MKATAITEHIVQLTRGRFVNAYLVRESDGFTLIDTTIGGGAAKLIGAARGAGGEIRRIALTHGHSDHIGSLDALKRSLPGSEVLIGDADARELAGEHVLAKRRGSWPKRLETRPDTLLTGGEQIGSLLVVATPGHTPGHVAFLDTRDRTVIAGDTFTAYVRLNVPNRLRQPFPLAAMGTEDREKVLTAAKRVQSLQPALLAVGHGPAIRTPEREIEAAIGRAS